MKLLSKLKFVLLGSVLSFGAVAAINSNDAVQTSAEGEGVTTVTDVIDSNNIADKTVAGLKINDAIYKGAFSSVNSMGFSGTSSTGIVSTISGGRLKSIAIEWDAFDWGSEAADRYIQVYASENAYSDYTDLYSSARGTELGTNLFKVSSNASGSASYTVEDTETYNYVGIRSKKGTIKISKISIVWEKQSFGTLDKIEIQNRGKTSFAVGESYDSSGIVALKIDAEGNKEMIPASDVKTDLDGHVFTEEDVPSVKNKVTYNGKTSEEFDIQVSSLPTFKKVTSEKEDWTGTYLIVGEKDGTLCAADSSLDEFDAVNSYKTVAATGDLIKANIGLTFKITKLDAGYSIQKQNGDYIGNTTSGSGTMSIRSTPILNNISFDTDDGLTITSGNGDSETYLRFYNAANQMRFRYYAKSSAGKLTGSAISLYEYQAPVSESLTAWANQINDTLICDNGVSAPSVETWNNIKTNYFDSKIIGVDLETIRSETGNPNGTTLQKALAKYDYIVSKYGDSIYSNYLDRNVSISLAQVANKLSIPSSSLITLVSILSAGSCVGIFLIIKRRKGTNN